MRPERRPTIASADSPRWRDGFRLPLGLRSIFRPRSIVVGLVLLCAGIFAAGCGAAIGATLLVRVGRDAPLVFLMWFLLLIAPLPLLLPTKSWPPLSARTPTFRAALRAGGRAVGAACTGAALTGLALGAYLGFTRPNPVARTLEFTLVALRIGAVLFLVALGAIALGLVVGAALGPQGRAVRRDGFGRALGAGWWSLFVLGIALVWKVPVNLAAILALVVACGIMFDVRGVARRRLGVSAGLTDGLGAGVAAGLGLGVCVGMGMGVRVGIALGPETGALAGTTALLIVGSAAMIGVFLGSHLSWRDAMPASVWSAARAAGGALPRRAAVRLARRGWWHWVLGVARLRQS